MMWQLRCPSVLSKSRAGIRSAPDATVLPIFCNNLLSAADAIAPGVLLPANERVAERARSLTVLKLMVGLRAMQQA